MLYFVLPFCDTNIYVTMVVLKLLTNCFVCFWQCQLLLIAQKLSILLIDASSEWIYLGTTHCTYLLDTQVFPFHSFKVLLSSSPTDLLNTNSVLPDLIDFLLTYINNPSSTWASQFLPNDLAFTTPQLLRWSYLGDHIIIHSSSKCSLLNIPPSNF